MDHQINVLLIIDYYQDIQKQKLKKDAYRYIIHEDDLLDKDKDDYNEKKQEINIKEKKGGNMVKILDLLMKQIELYYQIYQISKDLILCY